jgi:ATP-dependent DNA ligase
MSTRTRAGSPAGRARADLAPADLAPADLTPADLRPMPYGRTAARNVRNGIWEPLWGGQRVLIDLFGTDVRIRDQHGDALDGYDLLREAILASARSAEMVADGYLLPAPLRDTAGATSVIGSDSVMTAGEMGRQFLLGGFGGERRAEIEAEQARRVALPSSSPTAFVAIDLLWLDGESLLDVPLMERKRLLESVLLDGEVVRKTMTVRSPVEAWYAQWRALGFREVAVKDANSRYTPGAPSPAWATALIPRR